jgi:hypothetical protein
MLVVGSGPAGWRCAREVPAYDELVDEDHGNDAEYSLIG